MHRLLHIINFEPFATELRCLHKCSSKIVVYQSTQNLCKLIKYSSLHSQKCSYVISDITLMAPPTAEDWLLIKTLQIEKSWTVDRMIVEVTARQCTILFGMLSSRWYIIKRSRTLTVWNESWTVYQRCYKWPVVLVLRLLLVVLLGVDTLSIVSVNSVTSASLFVTNFISVKTLRWQCCWYWYFLK